MVIGKSIAVEHPSKFSLEVSSFMGFNLGYESIA